MDTGTGDTAETPAAPSAVSLCLPTTLRKRADFLRAASARRQGTAGFLLQGRDRADGDPAIRLGFIWEGRVRNAVVYKGRNRDTDWFSITDLEWPRVSKALDDWLDDANFDDEGRQRTRLAARPPENTEGG